MSLRAICGGQSFNLLVVTIASCLRERGGGGGTGGRGQRRDGGGSVTGRRFGSLRIERPTAVSAFTVDDRSKETAGLQAIANDESITSEDVSFSPVYDRARGGVWM